MNANVVLIWNQNDFLYCVIEKKESVFTTYSLVCKNICIIFIQFFFIFYLKKCF